MSKVVISPLLNSLFSKSDSMTKDEANRLVSVLSEVGDDTCKVVLAQSTSRAMMGVNYLYFHGEMGDAEVARGIEDCGFEVISSVDRGANEGFWMYFNRQ